MMNPAVIGPPVAAAAGGDDAALPADATALAGPAVLAAEDGAADVAAAGLDAAELVSAAVAAVLFELEQADNTRAVAIRAPAAPTARRVLRCASGSKGMA
ncbi:MAG TPA: hypothetical protein VGL75_11515 [Acidothermaceae bacterium]|jgi:hypothetical protein